jgi:type II secretory pathway component PulM
MSLVTLALLAQWSLSYLFERRPETLVARAFAEANRWLCNAGLSVALVFVFLPYFLGNISMGGGLAGTAPWWVCRCLIVVWAFDAARRSGQSLFAILGCGAVLGWSGSELVHVMGVHGWRWIPALWASIAALALPVTEILRRRLEHVSRSRPEQVSAVPAPLGTQAGTAQTCSGLRDPTHLGGTEDACIAAYRALSRPVEGVVLIVLWATAVVSLAVFTMPVRIAGAVSLVALLAVAWLRHRPAIRTLSLALVNWQIVAVAVVVFGPPQLTTVLEITRGNALPVCLPVAIVCAISVLLWQSRFEKIAQVHRVLLRVVASGAIVATFAVAAPNLTELLIAGITFTLLTTSELWAACRHRDESRVWIAEVIAGIAVGYFAWHGVIHFGHGTSMFIVLAVAVAARVVAGITASHPATAIMVRPFERTGMTLPIATVLIGLYRHVTYTHPAWLDMNSLGLLLAAGFYFWRGIERRERRPLVASAVVLNIALVLLWQELAWSDPQFYMIPIGLTILAIVRLLKDEIPQAAHDPLNYLGALVILVSPTFHIVAGSWLHLFSLMALSVVVVLLAIGFRVRAVMYMGGAFLVADLIAMIVRGSIDNPNFLWFAGVGLGAAVLALGAFAERNRELLLQRLRMVSAALESWN